MNLMFQMFRAISLVVLFHCAAFEETDNVNLLKQLYEMNLNSSIRLDREDRNLQSGWTVDFQVKRVNVSMKYRVQMIWHKEHSFRSPDFNAKWTECVLLHRRQIRMSEKDYYVDESECLTTITAQDKERTRAVEQMDKESRKWRRSYRYLVNTCNADNPGDQEASDLCLVQYMEKDNYNNVIQRLILLKSEAMGELYRQLNNSVKDLEECLKTKLSTYLEKVRTLMDTLNKCYNLTTRGNENEKI